MARPTTEKICIVCGKPFLPTGGRQLKCKRCGGKQRKKSGLEQAVQNADAQGISYGKYMSTKHKEEKTMAEQEKTAEVGTVKAQTACTISSGRDSPHAKSMMFTSPPSTL